MKCVQSWSLIWEKKKWYTWIVGHLLNQKNNSNVKKKLLKLQIWMYECGQTQRAGLWTGEGCGANSNFCQTIYRYSGFYFYLLLCVIYRCLNTCKNNSHMFHFKLFALFWYCNTSNAARRTRGEAPWRAALKDSLLTMEKEYTDILCCTSKLSTRRSPRNEGIVWKWGNLEMISHTTPPTQANNK